MSTAGVVTNVLTTEFEPGWWLFWSILVICAVVVHLGISRLDGNSAAATPGHADSREEQPAPAASAARPPYGMTVHAGRDISAGLKGRHHVGVVLIFGVVALLAPSLPVLLKDHWPESPETPRSSNAEPPANMKSIPRVVRGVEADSRGRRSYDVLLDRGYAYDLDVGPGDTPLKNYGSGESEPGENERDMYLSGASDVPDVWQIYVSEPPKRSPKPGELMIPEPGAGSLDCRDLRSARAITSITSGGAQKGDAACLRTSRGRWAMVEVLALPTRPGEGLLVRVTLYPPSPA